MKQTPSFRWPVNTESEAYKKAAVYIGKNSPFTDLALHVDNYHGGVDFIPLQTTSKLELVSWPVRSFRDHYEPSVVVVEQAMDRLIRAALIVGADDDVLEVLASLTNKLTKKEIEMARAKAKVQELPVTATEAVKTAKKTGKPLVMKMTDPLPAEEPKAAPVPKKGKAAPAKKMEMPDVKPTKAKSTEKTGRPSAAKMFRELIMEGKYTDMEIFKKVQDEFGIGDDKQSYVGWYRNQLFKLGENPPAPIKKEKK